MEHQFNVLNNYLLVGALLFSLGAVGFLTRRNLIVIFLCAEMMLQGVSVTLVAFSTFHGTWAGQVFAIVSLALAGAEAAIALALIVMLFQRGHSLDVSLWQDIREPDQPPIGDEFESDTIGPGDEGRWPTLTKSGRLPPQRPRREHVHQEQNGIATVDQAGIKHSKPAEAPQG